MDSKITQRIQRELGVPNLLSTLSEKLPASDLQSLLIDVYAKRASQLNPTDVFKNYQSDGFVKPATSDPLSLMAFDKVAFELAKLIGFEPIELSPVAPFGACSVVASVHQNKVLTTIRNTEAMSDNTNAMALECTSRRQRLMATNPKSAETIRLCSSQRLIRLQPLPDPRFLPHFKIFGLCTAGRDRGNFIFETKSLWEHLSFYLKLMTKENTSFSFHHIEVLVTELGQRKMTGLIETKLFAPLKKEYPTVSFGFYPGREQGRGYYQDGCFQINAKNSKGDGFMLADGGFTDWTQQYLSNKKERLLISGIGSELICLHYLKP